MLVDLEQEVSGISVAISHSFQPLDLVVKSLRDGGADLFLEPVEQERQLLPKAFRKFLECLKPACPRLFKPYFQTSSGISFCVLEINFLKTFLQKHGLENRFVDRT